VLTGARPQAQKAARGGTGESISPGSLGGVSQWQINNAIEKVEPTGVLSVVNAFNRLIRGRQEDFGGGSPARVDAMPSCDPPVGASAAHEQRSTSLIRELLQGGERYWCNANKKPRGRRGSLPVNTCSLNCQAYSTDIACSCRFMW
jgi:hypothetical protein